MVGQRSDYEPRSDQWFISAGLWLFWMPFGNRFIMISPRRTLGFYPLRWLGKLLMKLSAEHPHVCWGCKPWMAKWAHLGVEAKCPAPFRWRCGAHREEKAGPPDFKAW